MTRTTRHPLRVAIEAPARARRSIELVWELSTRAGRGLAERRELAGEEIVAVAVRVAGGPEARRAAVRVDALTRSGERRPLHLEDTHDAAWSREGDLEHVDIEGVLRCTIRHVDSAHAMYAHSPLLASLGIAAGTYSLQQRPGS